MRLPLFSNIRRPFCYSVIINYSASPGGSIQMSSPELVNISNDQLIKSTTVICRLQRTINREIQSILSHIDLSTN
jgi:hypothetical protein